MAKTLNATSVFILRVYAAVLVFGAVVVAARGYLRVGEQKEAGAQMYFFIGMALFWAIVLWLWSNRK